MGVAAVSGISTGNEHCDVSARRAAELGFVADHFLPPAAEDEDTADGLFAAVTNNAFAGRPGIEESGWRVWIMAARCYVLTPEAAARDRRAMREIATRCNGGLRVPRTSDVAAARVFGMLLGQEHSAWMLGRRASLLAYALNRSVIIREALPCFEEIGRLWQLRARNKRSAVCAAMNRLREEIVKAGNLPATFRFWFEKRADARVVYSQCQTGNDNRHGSGEVAVNYTQVMHADVPLKRRYARLKPADLRRELDALHAAAELRRLGIVNREQDNKGKS